MKSLLALLLAAAALPALAQAPAFTLKDAKALGAADTAQFYAANTAPIWDALSPEMKKNIKDPAGLQDIQHKITAMFGKEERVLHESVLLTPGNVYAYTRIVEFEKSEQSFLFQWSFNSDGKVIVGFGIHLEPNVAPTKFADYKDKTVLTLPLTGAWTVYQGGDSVGENYHAASIDERFAYDLCLVKDGALYSGDGSKPEDFYSFGQPVRAPGAGKIVSAVDQYADNAPGKITESDPRSGNSIVIDHGNGEFSMLAHLKAGSIKVKVGDTVKAGDLLAQVGLTGDAPIPFLDYHLQTTSVWLKGKGLPIQFQHLLVNGKPSPTPPVRGDIIEAKPTPLSK
ncbi:MAG: M23 family metallopeptidase [Acidobacteriaceae bacterium]|nr:M23 family metallopeptidase [Acidobacteriaceae bacterium]